MNINRSARCPHCGELLEIRKANLHPRDENTSIEHLDINVRTYNCLKRVGIDTIWELKDHSDSELMSIPNFGRGSLQEVKRALGEIAA